MKDVITILLNYRTGNQVTGGLSLSLLDGKTNFLGDYKFELLIPKLRNRVSKSQNSFLWHQVGLVCWGPV